MPNEAPYAITPEGVAESIKARMARRKGSLTELVIDCPDCPHCDLPLGWSADVFFRCPSVDEMFIRFVCNNCSTEIEMPLAK